MRAMYARVRSLAVTFPSPSASITSTSEASSTARRFCGVGFAMAATLRDFPRTRHRPAVVRRDIVDRRYARCEDRSMHLRMIHTGGTRDSLVTPADARTFDLMLQLRLQLVRCEPN